eukprot:gb/GECH01002948.1/.p1 GENE.gb/GECH01002948.1/~~gb/GECH01002948.1/.p1  ORF type:complete len:203 (+),score=36.67 gb/GECH01002948.1/:1-609(+)
MGCGNSKGSKLAAPDSHRLSVRNSNNSAPEQDSKLFKCLLIGDSSVGKTSLTVRLVDGKFTESFISTIGVDFKIHNLEINGENYKMHIWDTAGQERFRNITASYYRGAHAVVVIYDITNKESFENIQHWLGEIDQYADANITKFLVGNKCDLEELRQVSKADAQKYADSLNIKFIETSAKTNDNVSEAFQMLGEEIFKRRNN